MLWPHPVSTKLIFLSLDQNDNNLKNVWKKKEKKRAQKCADWISMILKKVAIWVSLKLPALCE